MCKLRCKSIYIFLLIFALTLSIIPSASAASGYTSKTSYYRNFRPAVSTDYRYYNRSTKQWETHTLGTQISSMSVEMPNGSTVSAYCVQAGKPYTGGNSYTMATNEIDGKTNWNLYTDKEKQVIALVIANGYPNTNYKTIKDGKRYWQYYSDEIGLTEYNDRIYAEKVYATQALVHEVVNGYRDLETFELLEESAWHKALGTKEEYPNAHNVYDSIVRKVKAALTCPSFAVRTREKLTSDYEYQMTLDPDTGLYTVTLTDTKNVLSDYDYASLSGNGITYSVSGNTLTITATEEAAETLQTATQIEAHGPEVAVTDQTITEMMFFTAVDSTYQNLVAIPANCERDPVPALFTLTAKEPKGTIEVNKIDAETEASTPQGDASLAGAVFGIYNEAGDEVATITTDDTGYATTGDELEFGTYTVKEKTAPTGYKLNSGWQQTVTVTLDNRVATLNADKSVKETVVKGGVELNKINAETGDTSTPDGTSLEGAEFTIVNKSANPVYYNGTSIAVDETVMTITTDATGKASSGTVLPYGTYEIHETKASTGYTVNTVWTKTFSITEDNQVVSYSGDEAVEEQVIRGDVKFTKKDTETGEPMASVVFKVTDKQTGESHIVVTDANGVFDSSSLVNSNNTNANDAAVSAEKTVTDDSLVVDAGIWFSGFTDKTTTPTDGQGPFVVGEYLFEELRCKANEKYGLVSFSVTITESGVTVDKENIYNQHDPEISTELIDNPTQEHISSPNGSIVLVDTVTYTHLVPGQEYTVTGTLMDKSTGESLKDKDGKEITVSATFTPETASGTVSVQFSFTGSSLDGKTVVAYERLYKEGSEVAAHTDIDDGDQSVYFPKITTNAADTEGNKIIKAEDKVTVIDAVKYYNFVPGLKYTVYTSAVDAATGEKIALADGGTELKSDFSPAKADGTKEITIELDGTAAAGKVIVITQEIYLGNQLICDHTSLKDKNQTVYVPSIATTAADADGLKSTEAVKEVTIEDTVEYKGLEVGETYTLTGTLMNKATGEALKDADGNAITATQEFTPEAADGSVKVIFTFNGIDIFPANADYSKIAAVAFETLTYDGRVIAVHEDIDDADQTVDLTRSGQLIKKDATSGEVLEGAAIEFKDETDDVVITSVTDETGIAYYPMVSGHTYSYHETKAPDGYELDETVYQIVVDADGNATGDTELINIRIGTVVIRKTDVISGDPVQGAEVTVFKVETNADTGAKELTKVFTQETDKRGRIYFWPDTYGDYAFCETKAPDGYYLNEEIYYFSIDESFTVTGTVEFTDVPFGTVVVAKVDKSGNPLKGARFGLYNAETGAKLGTATTGKNGRVYFASLNPGKYYYVEEVAPNGYKKNTTKHYFEIAEDYTVTGTLKVVNEKLDGPLTADPTNDLPHFIALAIGVAGLGFCVYALLPKRKKEETQE